MLHQLILIPLLCLLTGVFDIFVWETMCREIAQAQTKGSGDRDFAGICEAAGAIPTS